MLGKAIAAALSYESAVQLYEWGERAFTYRRAAVDARASGLALLVVGCPKWALHHGTGDYCLDLAHPGLWCVCDHPITADIRDAHRLFPPKSVIAFTSHVLEHLTPEEGAEAMASLEACSVRQYHVWPNRFSLSANLYWQHKSWPTLQGGRMVFYPRHSGVRHVL